MGFMLISNKYDIEILEIFNSHTLIVVLIDLSINVRN